MDDGQRVTGPREDLSELREGQRLRALTVAGPGVRSLRGLERLRSLETLVLERVETPDLALVEALPALRTLILDRLSGDVDFTPLERLGSITYLSVRSRPETVDRLLAVHLGRLRSVEDLKLSIEGPYRQVAIGWVGELGNLQVLALDGVTVSDQDVDTLCREGRRLVQVVVTPASAAQADRVAACLADRTHLVLLDAPSPTTAAQRTRTADGWSWRRDLTCLWAIDTNYEAEAMLIDWLATHEHALLDALEFDGEAEAVYVHARRANDLDRLDRVIATITTERNKRT